ncbi:uncharacterized protein VICG_00096 [Vittaforma corneae ATCC 50505]|uniref:SAM-dependent MTase RsmB/NOP-type domain-containing protein n=1 Tax=Vittaforma corneae (strain ATCC 50505) TaxID=993615 RepID=L2GPL9_VITCO|nr:uncharacterized protein VICG_00096 [Vittaforma corneae ATCC 50505]ELA42781.1 hypothetical protein VICG_00096 [Vittaforma corneae ATCC 50505]
MFRALDQRTQKFYNTVAKMVSKINSRRSTIKSEVYKTNAPERYQALLHKVLINYPVLQKVVKKTNFMKNIPLGTVVAYEILTKKIKNDGYRRKLKQALGDGRLKGPVTRTFVRINTLKATEEDLKDFNIRKTCIPHVYEVLNNCVNADKNKDEENVNEDTERHNVHDEYESKENAVEAVVGDSNDSMEEENCEENNADGNIDVENSANAEERTKGAHKRIKDIFTSKMFLEKVKIQNFSSCLPAFILNPEMNSTVIDAAASPGNKTTHLCSIMNNTGKIYAFERDAKRYQTLVEQIAKYGAENVEAIYSDFLKASPEQYKADYILLDPSCSGSGIHVNYVKNQQRINRLKNFQAMMLNHAFKFNPKAVVYSACSYHKEECEDVIKEALEKNPSYELEKIDNYTGKRGYEGYEFSDKVIRTSNDDETGSIGFFVALFRRK